jgi:hypothetical protein
MLRRISIGIAAVTVLALPAVVLGHPERHTVFPDMSDGAVPKYRTSGPANVVCKPDSEKRIKRSFRGRPGATAERLKLLDRCEYRNIQEAIDDAESGYRIQILPGVYKEKPSRKVPVGAYQEPPCADQYVETEGFANEAPPPAGPRSDDPPVRPHRGYHVNCPNSKNLIAIIGDPRQEPDPLNPLPARCTQLCNLQIEGMGAKPNQVKIIGDRHKSDVIRADRADGIFIRNLLVEQAEFNGIDIVETNGFRVSRVIARWNNKYGVLTFTAGHGLYDRVEGYGNGDAAVYPGSNAKGCPIDLNQYGVCDQGATTEDPRAGCGEPTTEMRKINSHHNVLGYSGTAGNSTYIHDSRFHHNATGLATDSFAQGHPGMPQECFEWTGNEIYSNNENPFTAENQEICRTQTFAERPKQVVCPNFQTAVGSGILIGGGNRDLLEDNHIYNNWRYGLITFAVPAGFRNDQDPEHQEDTGTGNITADNHFGVRPDGEVDPNGLDVWWDGTGAANCWRGNDFRSGPNRVSNRPLPPCPGSSDYQPQDLVAIGPFLPCTAWDPNENPRPTGCDWFDTPPEPTR